MLIVEFGDEGEIDLGLKLMLTPLGAPEAVKEIAGLPADACAVMVTPVDPPRLTVAVGGFAVM